MIRAVETDADLEAWLEVRNAVVPNEPATVRAWGTAAGSQRAGCIAGAGKDVYDTPVGQTRLCARLGAAADALACLRGVANQAYAGKPRHPVMVALAWSFLLGVASWGLLLFTGSHLFGLPLRPTVLLPLLAGCAAPRERCFEFIGEWFCSSDCA